MAVFTYQACPSLDASARNDGSALVRGTIAADSARHARELLREKRLDVIALQPLRSRLGLSGVAKRFGRTRGRYEQQFVIFIRELSTLLAVGTPMLKALDTTLGPDTQKHSRRSNWFGGGQGFKRIILQVRDRVAAGASLSEAFADHTEVFDTLTLRLVEVGERSGTLDDVLDRLAGFKERSASFRGRLTNAMIYPAIVLTMAVLVTLLLMTFVVPNILQPLIQSGRPLPTVTLWVKGFSDLIIGWWWLLGLGFAALLITLTAFLRSERGQRTWHTWQLKLPGVGAVVQKQETVRVATVVHTLIGSGIPFLSALEVAERTVRNRVFKAALADCREAVSSGREIAEALDQTDAFPPTVVQVFALGQASGRLEPMLERLATDYDKQVQQMAQRLTALLEPVMIVILAILIGFIAFATILPVLEAGQVL